MSILEETNKHFNMQSVHTKIAAMTAKQFRCTNFQAYYLKKYHHNVHLAVTKHINAHALFWENLATCCGL